MKVIVITFPGSNCDRDLGKAFQSSFGAKVEYLWHKERISGMPDWVLLPGGFSYGDYLRCGAMARFSPAMESLVEYHEKGGRVLGICNGFQILTEAGLLPGALIANKTLKYICKKVEIGSNYPGLEGNYKIPIAHGEGSYFASDNVLEEWEGEGRILVKYSQNPNGSLRDIAGICSVSRRVFGMMPHPERATLEHLGEMDGKIFLQRLVQLS